MLGSIENRVHVTTIKLAPRIGAGLRIKAAMEGRSVAEVAENAVKEVLQSHGRHPADLPPKARTGRPSPSLIEAGISVLNHPSTRNDAIPTRFEKTTAQELEALAAHLGKKMTHLAEEGARALLLRDGPDFAREIAGLHPRNSAEAAIERLRGIVTGQLPHPEVVNSQRPRGKRTAKA